jgi:hypothetical protein
MTDQSQTTPQTTTVIPLPAEMRDAMRRTANRGLMRTWINADLIKRASHDVRKSYVFYDEHGIFDFALHNLLSEEGLAAVYEGTRRADYPGDAISYWSKGI